MNPQKIEFQRYRDFGQIINVTFEFIRQNFKQLFKAIIFFVSPFILLAGIFSGLYQKDLFTFSATSTTLSQFGLSYGFYILFTMFTMIMLYAVVYSYIFIYLEREDETIIELDELWKKMKTYIPKLILYGIGYFIVVIIGLLLLIIPGIYLSLALVILFMVAFNENLGFKDSVKRCLYLIKNRWWFTFGLITVLGFIQGFLGFLFQIPQYVVAFMKAINSIDGGKPDATSDILIIITSIIGTFSFAFYVISITGIVFHYFSLVEQKEAKGLLDKIETM